MVELNLNKFFLRVLFYVVCLTTVIVLFDKTVYKLKHRIFFKVGIISLEKNIEKARNIHISSEFILIQRFIA